MAEGHARYFTEIKCPDCQTILAKKDAEGVVYMGTVPILATIAICPECHKPVSFSQFATTGNLVFSDDAISEIVKTLSLINGNGGFGTLIVRFQKARARWVGLGETLKDCQ